MERIECNVTMERLLNIRFNRMCQLSREMYGEDACLRMAYKLLERRAEVRDDERPGRSVTKSSPSEHRNDVREELNTDKDTVRH